MTTPLAQGVNDFTARTDAELARLRGVRPARLAPASGVADPARPPRKAGALPAQPAKMPPSVDWRSRGVVTAVKNPGGCGSCWAFAAAEAVESAFALATGRLEVLSPQQILDCTPNPRECGGDGGCLGGTPELAFAGIAAASGLASEWAYPYVDYHGGGAVTGPCRAGSGAPPVARLARAGFVKLPSNSYWPVLAALGRGPLAVNVDASAWFTYESGVFADGAGKQPDIDHAVTLVGYGTDAESGQDYWLVRNSWGTAWGEDGYMRLARSATPACASDVTPFDGSDCKNVSQPVAAVTVCGECGVLYDVSYPVIDAGEQAQPAGVAAF